MIKRTIEDNVDVKKAVTNVLKAFISNELGMLYKGKGQQKKMSFKDKNFFDVLQSKFNYIFSIYNPSYRVLQGIFVFILVDIAYKHRMICYVSILPL